MVGLLLLVSVVMRRPGRSEKELELLMVLRLDRLSVPMETSRHPVLLVVLPESIDVEDWLN